jgi:uncharacterized protein (DUF1501 family)
LSRGGIIYSGVQIKSASDQAAEVAAKVPQFHESVDAEIASIVQEGSNRIQKAASDLEAKASVAKENIEKAVSDSESKGTMAQARLDLDNLPDLQRLTDHVDRKLEGAWKK